LIVVAAGWLMFELYGRLLRGSKAAEPNLIPHPGSE
jgi:hypothetical protein